VTTNSVITDPVATAESVPVSVLLDPDAASVCRPLLLALLVAAVAAEVDVAGSTTGAACFHGSGVAAEAVAAARVNAGVVATSVAVAAGWTSLAAIRGGAEGGNANADGTSPATLGVTVIEVAVARDADEAVVVTTDAAGPTALGPADGADRQRSLVYGTIAGAASDTEVKRPSFQLVQGRAKALSPPEKPSTGRTLPAANRFSRSSSGFSPRPDRTGACSGLRRRNGTAR
jgi:hypothetical protein